MAQAKFTLNDLSVMLKQMGYIAASPIGRQVVAKQALRAIRRSQLAGPLLDKALLMYDFFCDPQEPVRPKFLIGAALTYLILPKKLVPKWLPLIGFTDEFAALAIVWNQTKDVLTNYAGRRQVRIDAGEMLAR